MGGNLCKCVFGSKRRDSRAHAKYSFKPRSDRVIIQVCNELQEQNQITKETHLSTEQKLAKTMLPIVRTDNRLVETLSKRCRPSNIAQLYNTLESQEWVDAKETLEEITDFQEEDIVQFLCACVMISFQSSMEVYNALSLKIAELLWKPTLVISNTFEGKQTGEMKLPDDITGCIRHQLRQHFDDIDSEGIISNTFEGKQTGEMKLPDDITGCIRHQLRQHFDDIDSEGIVEMMCKKLTLEFSEFVQRHPHKNKVVQKFMNRCAKVTWQMVIQHPPMWLSVDDREFDGEKHKLWWSCDYVAANHIDYFVWPALYDYKQGNLLIKGCVYAK